MKFVVSEKVIENCIREFPKELLGESLDFIAQQRTIGGLRPDLLFQDAEGRDVVVELQLGPLNKGHLYRSLEYRDAIAEPSGRTPRVILVSEDLRGKHENAVRIHNLEHVTLKRDDVVKRVRAIDPSFRFNPVDDFEEVQEEVTRKHITKNQLMRKLCGKSSQREKEMDKWVYWIGEYDDARLPSHKNNLPTEYVISGFDELSHDEFKRLCSLLDCIRWDWGNGTGDVIFGQRGYGLIGSSYESYISGRKMALRTIWHLYNHTAPDMTHKELVEEGLHALSKIKFHCGKYPSYIEVPFISSFEMKCGLDVLMEDHFVYKNPYWIGSMEDSIKKELSHADRERWIGAKIISPFRGHHKELSRFLRRICNNIVSPNGMKPRRLGEIPQEALILSSVFFPHLDPDEHQFETLECERSINPTIEEMEMMGV